jgi:hypothetical protein
MILETFEDNETGQNTPMMTFGYSQRTRIGFWNIRSLLGETRLAEVCREMHRYDIKILGLSEVRKQNSGSEEENGNLLLFSGSPSESQRGVGIVVCRSLRNSLQYLTGL